MFDNKSCLERIKEVYSSLNAKEQKVAKYILDNAEDIVHFSITDVKPMGDTYKKINENDNMDIMMQKLLSANEYNLENTVKLNSNENLEKAVNLILNSGEIIFYGMGGSGCLAYDAYHKFVRTGIRCAVNTDSHWQAMISSMAKKDDVIIAFSNSGTNKELIESMKIGIKNGVKIISITGNEKSPISKVSDVVLVSYGQESNFRSEAMESRLSVLMIVDALYVGVAIKRKKETFENLEKIRKGIAKKRY